VAGVPASYEELDFRRTALGDLLLRRRRTPGLPGVDIYEVKLDDDLLMSSLLTDSERALADFSLPEVTAGAVDVLVGGLGLGYTADAALTHDRVRSLTVVELLPEVIDWHERGLVPLGASLTSDPRCRFLAGDFFRLVTDPSGADLRPPPVGYGAILVDIDHAPDSWLHPAHESFYGESGLGRAAALLRAGGVFGFWSSGATDATFSEALETAFTAVEAHEVTVFNPLIGEDQVDTVYVARKT